MISPAELPINPRGAVYHLDLRPEEIADIIITVGDPGRVSQVSQYFDSIEIVRSHREFITHTGRMGNKRLTVLSTGIGIPNIDIVMNELDALANVNLNTRQILPNKKQLSIIRLGTTGGLITDCKPGDIVISRYAIGFDGLLDYYQYTAKPALNEFKNQLKRHLQGGSGPFYFVESSPDLIQEFSSLGQVGITATCGGFYGPQGRHVRLPLRYPEFIAQLATFRIHDYSVVNLEMETAAIYALGEMLGHRCLSLSVVLANRQQGTFVSDVTSCLETLISKSLDKIKHI
ncbi:nucleoside phosphorylase [Legionella waltersii]|uniref:Purine nucleoside phosphorylase II n=1 Tax=Legionella waltersii TaxID=66969 RepID=A0A0W1ALQ1_9GAMM|nr:nucleoside phosphorylase [Legionella waltersii]KTD82285.1 purine nucleoside phosphorylase II [Legionella waltersii]SNV04272.1 purine nucleoside phosphorylase II [Legionella waltersii]